jgi:hypothetical protein
MAAAHSTAKARLGRNRRLKSAVGGPSRRRLAKQVLEKAEASDRGTAMRIRGRLREFLESEQGFLLKAESLLLCIAKSMDDTNHPSTGPYYPDVVELASELLGRRARSIDELLLDGRLPAIMGHLINPSR